MALELYAPEKGRISRWILGVSAALLLAYGAWSLYFYLPEGARSPLFGWQPLGKAYPISIALISAIVALIGGLIATWWAINHAKLVDFLENVERELHKVSWANKLEVKNSSIVVIIVTLVLAGWVALWDVIFAQLQQWAWGVHWTLAILGILVVVIAPLVGLFMLSRGKQTTK
ncbi:MAG: preprotein translocase subunit SecE [Planctomycetota bacterium]|jgi:preprotein translocase SecE subunit